MNSTNTPQARVDKALETAIEALDRVAVEIAAVSPEQQKKIGKQAVAELQWQTQEFSKYTLPEEER